MATRKPFQPIDSNKQPASAPSTEQNKQLPSKSTDTSSKKRKSDSNESSTQNKAAKTSGKKDNKKGIPDVSDIHLPGEDNASVQVWETPAEVRKKLSAFMRRDGITLAALGRVAAQQFPADHDMTLNGGQVSRFRQKKGVDGGNESPVFYGLYVFFEKLRIKENKKKTKFREEMEDVWKSEGGFPAGETSMANTRLFCKVNERLYFDKYGKLQRSFIG